MYNDVDEHARKHFIPFSASTGFFGDALTAQLAAV